MGDVAQMTVCICGPVIALCVVLGVGGCAKGSPTASPPEPRRQRL